MSHAPLLLVILFVVYILVVIIWLYLITNQSLKVTIFISIWLLFQGILGLTGFYLSFSSIPPRFVWLIGPPILFVVGIFLSKQGKAFVDELSEKWITYFQVMRLPAEFFLWGLYVDKQVPQLMTFFGNNFDVVIGLSAPWVAHWGYEKKRIGKSILIMWNLIGTGLLFNIVYHGIFSAPSFIQRLAFEQPNTGVFYFPFMWLPSVVLPLAFFMHFVCLRKLALATEEKNIVVRSSTR